MEGQKYYLSPSLRQVTFRQEELEFSNTSIVDSNNYNKISGFIDTLGNYVQLFLDFLHSQ